MDDVTLPPIGATAYMEYHYAIRHKPAAWESLTKQERRRWAHVEQRISMIERERCAVLAHNWPAPTSGRIPLEISSAIRNQPIER